MTYSPTTRTLINATTFPGTSLPSWLTAITSGASTVSVAGGQCVLGGVVNQACGIAINTALPSTYVIRQRATLATSASAQCVSAWLDSAALPAVDTFGNWTANMVLQYGATNAGNYATYWRNGSPDVAHQPGQFTDAETYIFEIVGNAVGVTLTERDKTTLAVMNTDAVAWGNTGLGTLSHSAWVVLGGVVTWGIAGLTILEASVMESLKVTVTDLDTNDVVKLYNAANTLLATGSEAGGEAEFDCQLVDFGGVGVTGYFKVFESDGVTEKRRLPAAGTVTIWGGDIWPGVDTPPIPPAPDPWNIPFDESRPFMTGRVVCENGDVVNFADLLEGNRIVSATGRKPNIPETGRVVKEDNSIINIADLLEG